MPDDILYVVQTDCYDRACPDNPEHECGEALFATTDHSTAQEVRKSLAEVGHITVLLPTKVRPKGWKPVKWFELDAMVKFHPREGDDPIESTEQSWFSFGEGEAPRDVRAYKYAHCVVVRGEALDDGEGNNALRFEVNALANRIRGRIASHRQECMSLPDFQQVDTHWFYDISCTPAVAD